MLPHLYCILEFTRNEEKVYLWCVSVFYKGEQCFSFIEVTKGRDNGYVNYSIKRYRDGLWIVILDRVKIIAQIKEKRIKITDTYKSINVSDKEMFEILKKELNYVVQKQEV